MRWKSLQIHLSMSSSATAQGQRNAGGLEEQKKNPMWSVCHVQKYITKMYEERQKTDVLADLDTIWEGSHVWGWYWCYSLLKAVCMTSEANTPGTRQHWQERRKKNQILKSFLSWITTVSWLWPGPPWNLSFSAKRSRWNHQLPQLWPDSHPVNITKRSYKIKPFNIPRGAKWIQL